MLGLSPNMKFLDRKIARSRIVFKLEINFVDLIDNGIATEATNMVKTKDVSDYFYITVN